MQKFLISIAILLSALAFVEEPVKAEVCPTTAKTSVVLKNKDHGGNKSNRCPAMPIYGAYDGYTLSIDVVADDEAATYELVVTTAATHTVGQYTAVELNHGVAVPPLQPAKIELTTPAGAVYVGEITD